MQVIVSAWHEGKSSWIVTVSPSVGGPPLQVTTLDDLNQLARLITFVGPIYRIQCKTWLVSRKSRRNLLGVAAITPLVPSNFMIASYWKGSCDHYSTCAIKLNDCTILEFFSPMLDRLDWRPCIQIVWIESIF